MVVVNTPGDANVSCCQGETQEEKEEAMEDPELKRTPRQGLSGHNVLQGARIGPEQPGDVILLLRHSATVSEESAILGQHLRRGLIVKVRSIRAALRRARDDGQPKKRKNAVVCCPCCATSNRCCARFLFRVLPDCVVVNGAEDSDLDKAIFVTGTPEWIAAEHFVRESEILMSQWGVGGAGRRAPLPPTAVGFRGEADEARNTGGDTGGDDGDDFTDM